jgi:hypothetical protein
MSTSVRYTHSVLQKYVFVLSSTYSFNSIHFIHYEDNRDYIINSVKWICATRYTNKLSFSVQCQFVPDRCVPDHLYRRRECKWDTWREMRTFNLVEDKMRKFKGECQRKFIDCYCYRLYTCLLYGECVHSFASASFPFTHSPLNVRNLSSTSVPFSIYTHDSASDRFSTNSLVRITVKQVHCNPFRMN